MNLIHGKAKPLITGVLGFLFLLAGYARAQTVTATVGAGTDPVSVAVNPVTNKVYVANVGSNNVTVIDGATNTTATVAVGTNPVSVAVNPVTNQVYVVNAGSNNVTVIDGATNTTATVAAGTNPVSVALNPVTNQVYVANNGSGNVTVIDGATNTTATVGVGTVPVSVAVNPATNQVYVANAGSANVTVIDGATNTTATVGVGTRPVSVAVNPVTNKVYVANVGSNNVTVIDGATNTTTMLAVARLGPPPQPVFVAVNPVTNKVYVATGAANTTVIDGATNATATVATGAALSVAVNPVTNQVYVANVGGINGNVTVIDGATNTTATVAVGTDPVSVAVNPVTNKVYVPNELSNNVTVIDGATNTTATVAVGPQPFAVAVNPVTNQVYVPDISNNVTVIDGATSTTATVAVGAFPASVAVNPVTNQVYVANSGSNNVTVIDGATNTTATVAVGTLPFGVAVNPVTNQVYVANFVSNNVTVIDGATNTTATVAVGTEPISVAVNPVTNKVYVANSNCPSSPCGPGTVTVIDGATNTTATVAVGITPLYVAVNPVTNKVYVANQNCPSLPCGPGTVTVIDGATNTTATVTVGIGPRSMALNPLTNKVYVASANCTSSPCGPGTVTVIDGATNTTATVAVGILPLSVAVNPVTNKVYVSNICASSSPCLSTTVTVIDGATNTTATVGVGTDPDSVAVNPVTNQVYVANSDVPGNVTVLTEQQVQTIPLTTTIGALPTNQTTSPTPAFTFTASSTFSPTAPPVDAVYFQLDTWQGVWAPASPTGTPGSFTATLPTLSPGIHILYAYATDGQDASTIQTGGNGQGQGSPVIGNIAAYLFLFAPQTINSVPLTITANNASRQYGAADPSFTASYSGFVNGDTSAALGGTLTCAANDTPSSPAGTYAINCSGQTSPNYSITYVTGTLTITPAPLVIAANNASRQYGAPDPAFTAAYTGFVNGDTPAALTGALACTGGDTASTPVGAYAINCSGQSSPNYSISNVPGTLAITPAPLSVVANSASRAYGAANPAFTGTIAGLQNGDNITANYSTSATPASPVGNYAITPTLVDLGGKLGNYAVTLTNGTLTVTAAPLMITANNATRGYGQPNPPFGPSYSGFVNGENASVLAGTLTCASPATPSSPVAGSPYAISCSGLTSSNYAITYAAGALTITAAPLTITANGATKILNAPLPAFGASYSGFVNGEGPSVLIGSLNCTTTATATSPVGSYPITCSGLTAANYAISWTAGTLKVMYAPAGVCGHVILPPIDPAGTTVGNQGRTVPAKFQVCDANGVSIGTPGVVTSFFLTQIITGTATASVEDIVDTNNPDTAFRWDGTEWIFNITTQNLSAGSTYIYTITLNDGSTIMFQFGLR